MLKQRHQSSILSSKLSKTLSRPKFINKPNQEAYSSFLESGKQTKTLRNASRNKSCYIPNHLAQSTQSHIIHNNSMESKNNKSTAKNFSISQNKITNFNLMSHIDPQTKNYLSSNFTTIIPENLIQDTKTEKADNQLIKSNFVSNISNLQAKNLELTQQLLSKQVEQMFLYKSKQLTKALEQMHNFCICVKELKWICEQTHEIIKVYNQKISIYYKEYFQAYRSKSDIQNVVRQSQILLKKFNQIESFNINQQGLFNFNILSNRITNSSVINPSQVTNIKSDDDNKLNSKSRSAQNAHSWSKLIQNIKQQHFVKPFPDTRVQLLKTLGQKNKNFTTNTFQLTENNSPFKNKTLKELIKLSQLRKSEYRENQNSQNKENNQNNMNTIELNRKDLIQIGNFSKKIEGKRGIQGIGQYKEYPQQSPTRDPFDSIHLPYFNNNKNSAIGNDIISNPNNLNNPASNISSQLPVKKQHYESEINRLKNQIQNLDKDNNDYFRKLRNKNVELESQKDKMIEEMREMKEFESKFKIQMERLKQQRKQLKVENTRLNRQVDLQRKKFNHYESKVTQQISNSLNYLIECNKNSKFNSKKLQSYTYLPNQQFDRIVLLQYDQFCQLISHLQNILKVTPVEPKFHANQSEGNTNIMKQNSNKDNIKSNSVLRSSKQNFSIQPKAPKTQRHFINSHKDSFDNLSNEIKTLENQRHILQQQISQLQSLKQQFYNELQNPLNQNRISTQAQYQIHQLVLMQAHTIQQMLQNMENQEDE